MSIINVVEHDEIIYNILYQPPPPRPKSPMYVSERKNMLKRQKITPTHATMGYAEVPLNTTECFLRKGGGIHPQPKEVEKFSSNRTSRPPVPKHIIDKKKEKPDVNFPIQNIKNAIHLKPRKPDPKLVDTPGGHTHDANDTKFKCVHLKKFGNVPKYLAKQNKDILKTEMEYKLQLEQQEPLCKPISPEERQQLLDGLKENWAKLQKAFLLLPMLTDTIPKIIKKKKMEDQLRELEKDIRLVDSNPYIYIYD